MNVNSIRKALCVATITFAFATTASAQGGGLEEIVITARKVEESLQETPVAVSAFTAETLESRSIDSVFEVAAYSPNVTAASSYSGGTDGFYYIRGVGVNDFTAAFDPPVGVYVDGVYLGRTTGNTFDLVDAERIEVLRGPQGTLFGRNTSGGAISVTTARPSGELRARASFTGGSRDRLEGRAMIEFPIGDTFSGRLTFMHREQDGWVDRLTDGITLGDEDTDAGRLVLNWAPREDFNVLLSADYSERDGTSAPQITTDVNTATTSPCFPFCIPLQPAMLAGISPSFDQTLSSQRSVLDLKVWGVSTIIDWDVGPFALRSITAYRRLNSFNTNDFDVTPIAFYDFELPTKQHQVSEELQISGTAADGRFKWLGGFFYYSEVIDQTNGINLGASGPAGIGFGIPGGLPMGGPFGAIGFVVDPALPLDDRFVIRSRQRIKPDIDAIAVFGNATFEFTDRLSVNAGVRWSRDKKKQDYDFQVVNTIPGHPIWPVGVTPALIGALGAPVRFAEAKDKWTSVDPRIGFDYQVTDDVLLYVSYAEGFRSGGFNSRPVVLPIGGFEPEDLSTYEGGIKSEWFDNRLRVNAAAFHSAYDNVQIGVLQGGFFGIENAGDATVNGFELEVVARPMDHLQVDGGFGYLDAEYDSVTAAAVAAGVLVDNELPMSPEVTFNVGAQYDWALGDLGTFTLRGDFAYVDDRFSFANNAPGNHLDSHGLLNIRGTWLSADEHWQVSAFGLNVVDEKYYRWAEDVRNTASPLGTLILYPAPPAEWGVTLEYRY